MKQWNSMYNQFIKPVIKYILGVGFWMVFISVLELTCTVKVTTLIDGLWTKKINDYFVENLAGAIAFDASSYGCDGRYIYTAKYYPGDQYNTSDSKSLSSVVDLGSWRKVDRSSVTTTYMDSNYRYVVKQNSDGVTMEIFDKWCVRMSDMIIRYLNCWVFSIILYVCFFYFMQLYILSSITAPG